MADNINVKDSVSGLNVPVATDDIGGVGYQKVKFGWGADGAWNETADTDGIRIPIGGAQIGATNEAPAFTDTAVSGLNGRLQRIAQRLTALTLQLPSALGAGGGLKIDGSSTPLPVSGGVGASQSGTWTVQPGNIQNTTPWRTGPYEAVIACSVGAGSTLSPGIDLTGLRNMGLLVPSTFDGSVIGFQVSDILGGTYVPLFDITNNQVFLTIAPSRAYDLPGELMAWRFLRISCNTTQAGTSTDFLIVGKS